MTQAEEPRLERVVVLEGGISSEREVSLLSGRGVKEALASKGLEVESWDPAVDSVGGLEEGAYDALLRFTGPWARTAPYRDSSIA